MPSCVNQDSIHTACDLEQKGLNGDQEQISLPHFHKEEEIPFFSGIINQATLI